MTPEEYIATLSVDEMRYVLLKFWDWFGNEREDGCYQLGCWLKYYVWQYRKNKEKRKRKEKTKMTDKALIAYIAGRLEALLSYTGQYDAVSSMSCDLMMFKKECDKLHEICFRQLDENHDPQRDAEESAPHQCDVPNPRK
jgi:hypothetical protein